jgi:hypothetical protein
MTYDFRPEGLHIFASWLVLARIAARHTDATVLTSRDVMSLYLQAQTSDWFAVGESERAFAEAALDALAALPPPSASKHPLPKPLDTRNLPSPKGPL